MLSSIKSLSERFAPDAVKVRRHLHAHPELSFHEQETARFVASELTALGLTPQEGVAGTGVVALIKGTKPGDDNRVVGLRADMDALPIREANDVPYKSTVDGVMHACGHDVHTSSLLATAR
ncbi:MAG: M20/M25/M40 family metallo-hydrolase, partial [Cytophagaceae bacterium]